MIARLNGKPLKRIEGNRKISFMNPTASVKEFANEALRRQPVTIVLKQVTPKRAMFTQGNFCGGACSKNISADGLKELSMKLNCSRGHNLRLRASIQAVPCRACALRALALRGPRLQRLQVLAGLEPNSLSGRDVHLGTSPWIPSNARLAWFHRKHAESSQLDPIVGFEGIFHTIEDRIHCLFRFRLAHSRPLYDLIHKIEFNHWNLRFRLKPTTTICCTYF